MSILKLTHLSSAFRRLAGVKRVALCHRSGNSVFRSVLTQRERLPRDLQLEPLRQKFEPRDLPRDGGVLPAGRALPLHFNTVRPKASAGNNTATPPAWLTEAPRGMDGLKARRVFSVSRPRATETGHIRLPGSSANISADIRPRVDQLSRRQEKCSTRIGR